MTADEYNEEYERLFNWRQLWNQLSNSKRFRLAVQNERIEEKAARANRLIGKLIAGWDAEHATPPPTTTEAELDTLMNLVVNRMRESFKEKCDCPLHLLSKEERAAKIDEAIAATVKGQES